VLLMSQQPNNGLTIGDLFCGAGIGAIGMKLAGFKTAYAFDNNSVAVDTFNRNIEPIATLEDAHELDITALPLADIIVAGFPCKCWSVAGKSLGLQDRKYGDLGSITVDIILKKQPKAFLIENVGGIIAQNNMLFFEEVLNLLGESYNIAWKYIDCSDYGVPQKRNRVFVIGMRKDLNLQFNFPPYTHVTNKRSVLDAIGDLPKLPTSDIPNHGQDCGIRKDEKPFVNKIPVGGNWKDLPLEDQMTFMKGGFHSEGGRTGALYKVDPTKPAKTILSSPMGKATAQILHWEGHAPRRFTVRESLRLQTVPDTFTFDESIPLLRQYDRCSGIPSYVTYLFSGRIAAMLNGVDNIFTRGSLPKVEYEDW